MVQEMDEYTGVYRIAEIDLELTRTCPLNGCINMLNERITECNNRRGQIIMCELVAYFRVSTAKQGRSGLGLEAQRTAVESYAQSVGKSTSAEFVEIEGGGNNDRAEL